MQVNLAEYSIALRSPMIRLGVLISGSGTNLQALIDSIASGALDASIVLVISSKPGALGLERAEKAGIPTLALNKNDYANPLAADKLIAAALSRADSGSPALRANEDEASSKSTAGVDYVVMAGYMRKVHEPLLKAFPHRIINIHPALLPSFKGAHAIEDAFASGVKVTGVTVHFANEHYDEGSIIAQRAVTIEEDDSLESLAQKIHAVEHRLYPEVLQWFAEDRVHRDDNGKVRIA